MFKFIKKRAAFVLITSIFISFSSFLNSNYIFASPKPIYDLEEMQMKKTIHQAALKEAYTFANFTYIKDDIYFSDETKDGIIAVISIIQLAINTLLRR